MKRCWLLKSVFVICIECRKAVKKLYASSVVLLHLQLDSFIEEYLWLKQSGSNIQHVAYNNDWLLFIIHWYDYRFFTLYFFR